MRNRLRCLLGRHAYSDWTAWTHAGRSGYWRSRSCARCEHVDIDSDGCR